MQRGSDQPDQEHSERHHSGSLPVGVAQRIVFLSARRGSSRDTASRKQSALAMLVRHAERFSMLPDFQVTHSLYFYGTSGQSRLSRVIHPSSSLRCFGVFWSVGQQDSVASESDLHVAVKHAPVVRE